MKTLKKGQQGSVSYEIKLTAHTGKTYDITSYVTEIEVIEDITALSTIGKFSFLDTMGIKEFMPLLGGEKLSVFFQTDETFEEWRHENLLINVGNEKQIGEGNTRGFITVYFYSEDLLEGSAVSISRSFKKKKICEIIDHIHNKVIASKKSLIIDSTEEPFNYIAPFITASEAIKQLFKKCFSSKWKDAGYLYYEDKDNFNLRSLTDLYNQQPEKDFYLHNVSTRYENNKAFIGNITFYETVKFIDLLNEIKKGATGSTYYVFDYLTKNFERVDVNSKQALSQSSIGRNTAIPEKFMENRTAIATDFQDFIVDRIDNGVDFPNSIDTQVKIKIRNDYLYNTLNENVLVAYKFGDSELTCGKTINVINKSHDSHQRIDEKMDGRYLMKITKHKINATEGFTQVCMLTKNMFTVESDNLTVRK